MHNTETCIFTGCA